MPKKVSVLFLCVILALLMVSCDSLDKSELQEAVNIKIKAEDYTEESYALYKQKYDEAILVLEDSGTTETKIQNAANELNAAISSLVKRSDFTVLEGILAQTYSENKYTGESYKEYREAYDMAMEVFNNKNSRQSSVNSAVKLLRDKIESLIPKADLGELDQLLILNVEKDKYTSSSYNNYLMIYNAAQLLKKKAAEAETPDQVADCKSEVQLCVVQLKNAIEKLELRGDTAELQNAYDNANSVYNGKVEGVASSVYYSENSYKNLGTALTNAKNALVSDNMNQKAIDEVKLALEIAFNSLEVSNVRVELYDLVTKTQKEYLSHSDYFTETTFEALNDAINAAIDEYNSSSSTNATLKAAMKKLEEAIDALEYVIIIGTGKTDFDFSSFTLKVGMAEVGLADYFVTPEEFIAMLMAMGDENVLEITGSLEDALTVKMADMSEVIFTRRSVVIRRTEANTDEDIADLAGIYTLNLMGDENSIIEAMNGNPTQYYVEDVTSIFVYNDAENGFELTAKNDIFKQLITEIKIEYKPYI